MPYPAAVRRFGRLGLGVLGPILTLTTILFVVALRPTIPITAPGVPLLLTVAVAAVLGGVASGMASALILVGFISIDASVPGTPFRYEPESVSRLVVNVVSAPLMAVLVGGLARRLRLQDGELQRVQAEDRDRALTEAATDGIITIDATSRVRSANPAAHALFGHPPGALIGRPLTDLMPEGARAGHLAGLESYLQTGARHIDWSGTELIGLQASGAEVPVEVSFAEYGAGPERRFIGIVRDVRHRRDLEEQLRQAQKMEALGRLAGGVAHDFSNILTAVYGFTELARVGLPPGDERHTQLGYVIDAAARGRDLVGQLLAFGRRQVLTIESLDLPDVVASIEPMLRRLIGAHITVTVRAMPRTRPIRSDRSQLGQVILNLALNARDAMPDGGELIIETGTVELDMDYAAHHGDVEPGSYTVLTVSDTGSGMDAQTKAHIFEPFFTTKAEGHGTGLGLATVHGVVAQTGGRITVYSEPGKGTTFRAYFPAHGEAAPADAEVDVPAPRGSGETVLVVEDEDSILELARLSLERLGYRVVTARTPDDALEIAVSTELAVLLTDVVMPGGSGVELATRIRAEAPVLPVVFMSGYAAGLLEQQGAMRAGDVYLAKPFTIASLGQAIARALGQPD